MGSNYAGADWASEKDDLLVAHETGEAILAATFAHDERGLTALCKALVRLKVALVAIERPDGLLIERLLDAGLRVMAIHPNQVAAARPPASAIPSRSSSRGCSNRVFESGADTPATGAAAWTLRAFAGRSDLRQCHRFRHKPDAAI